MPSRRQPQPTPAGLRRSLLAWYDRHRRLLPWRAPPGRTPDPYRVWVSEIMLQQTTVAAVVPYFKRFIARWPTVGDLAAASLDDVLHAWQGLGYYARARNLHRCARRVAAERSGRFPEREDDLRRLPGIGPYTAAAIAAIAFEAKATPVDANVARVIARVYALGTPPPNAIPRIRALAALLTPGGRPGDFAQAMMDLGATVCTPRKPACGDCPWRNACAARGAGCPEAFPVMPRPRARPTRRGVVFWAERADGAVFLRRRPERGLLGGMMEFPSTEWRSSAWSTPRALAFTPAAGEWRRLPGVVTHTFTHFRLELAVLKARVDEARLTAGVWCLPDRLADHALPTVMRKVARRVRAEATAAPTCRRR